MKKVERHQGRFAQTRIYLGKFLRMFVYQNDWKVLPMGAVIAAVVTFVVGANMFRTQEGTAMGCFALVCVSIWNGFFNSIQVVCRERSIIKREHRAGLYISSYIFAQMIYQLLLCTGQTVVTLLVCRIAGVAFPAEGLVTPWSVVDLGVTLLLVTYAADLMALMVSCIVRTTTTAMTAMPFLLIFQLIFSGSFFELSGFAEKLTVLTASRWGLISLCAIGRYNEQPMVTLWNTVFRFKDVEVGEMKPLLEVIKALERETLVNDILAWSGAHNQNPLYASTVSNVLLCWGVLLLMAAVFAAVAILALGFIDRDKR